MGPQILVPQLVSTEEVIKAEKLSNNDSLTFKKANKKFISQFSQPFVCQKRERQQTKQEKCKRKSWQFQQRLLQYL